jgi:hypothetical protein
MATAEHWNRLLFMLQLDGKYIRDGKMPFVGRLSAAKIDFRKGP